MRVMLVDAFDSFVYVIEQYYSAVGAETRVVRVNDDPIAHYRQWQPQLLVLGPGPGTPEDHGYPQIIRAMDEQQAIFGVCLGHQALANISAGSSAVRPPPNMANTLRFTMTDEASFRTYHRPSLWCVITRWQSPTREHPAHWWPRPVRTMV
jgi:anthranilate/para-aminobenzoate synthase component II